MVVWVRGGHRVLYCDGQRCRFPSDWLMVSWSSDKDGSLGNPPQTRQEMFHAFADLTVDNTITMTVADEVGATCTDLTYTVGTPPEVYIGSPVNGDTATEGHARLYCDCFDPKTARCCLLEWTLNGNPYSTQGVTSTGTAQFTDDALSHGSYTLVVTPGYRWADRRRSNQLYCERFAECAACEQNPTAATNNALSASILNPSVDPEGATVTDYVWLKDNVVQPSQTAQTVLLILKGNSGRSV